MARYGFVMLLLACAAALSKASTPSQTSTPNTRKLTTESSSKLQSRSNYYYLDDPVNCNGPYDTRTTKIFMSSGSDAYVKAYDKTRGYRRYNGGCAMTFGSYGVDGMKFKFNNAATNYINDCGVTLNIYDGSSVYGTLLASYKCHAVLSTSRYIYTDSDYITVQLINTNRITSPNYYFSLHIQNWDDYQYFNGGDIAGVVIGSVFFLVILICILLCVRARRIRRRRLMTETLIAAPSTTAGYPTGQAPYPNNYGTVTNPPNPPQPYPPAGSSQPYPPAGSSQPYPPAGSSQPYPPAGSSQPYPPATAPPPYQPADNKPAPPVYNP